MKTSAMRWGLGAVLLVSIFLVQATPAEAQRPFPQRYSIAIFDISGFLIDCVDFVSCTLPECPADFLFAGKRCTYTAVEVDPDDPFITHTSILCRNIVWEGFDLTRRVSLEVTCNTRGTAFWRFIAGTFATGSCAFEAARRNIVTFGGLTFSEGYGGVTLAGIGGLVRGTCADLFFGSAPEGVQKRMPRSR